MIQGIALTIFHGTEAIQERDTDEVLLTHRFASSGEITVRALPTTEAIEAYKIGNFIITDQIYDVFIIEKVEISEDQIIASGRSIDAVLARRVFEKTEIFSGTAKSILEGLLTGFTGARSLPVKITVNDENLTQSVDFQKTGATPYDVLLSVCDQLNLGYTVTYDFTTGTISLSVIKGSKTDIIFSPEYDNATSCVLQGDISSYATTAYVAGEGEGSAQAVATAGSTTASGLNRYEIYIDQRQEKKEESDTNSTYLARLKAKGTEELALRGYSEAFSADLLQTNQYTYGEDYSLGDYVRVEHPIWGVSSPYQVVEVEESQTASGYTLTPIFAKRGDE